MSSLAKFLDPKPQISNPNQASLDEAKRKEAARLKALEEEWRSKCKAIDKHNAVEKQKYYDGIKARQMLQLVNLQTGAESIQDLGVVWIIRCFGTAFPFDLSHALSLWR